MDKQRFWEFSSHTGIIIGMMFVVFFVIDRFNPAMEFLTSSISKWLMLVLAICAILNGLFSAIFLFQKQRRREERAGVPHPRYSQEPQRGSMRYDAPEYDSRGNAAPLPMQRARSVQDDRPVQRQQSTAAVYEHQANDRR